MEWVAIDVHIAGDAVTHRLAERFRLHIAEAAGLLTLTFAGMVQHAQDGSLADITDSQLEAWATWHGKKGQFAAFFREQLCDESGIVRAWEQYNGRAIRRAEAAKERSRAYREQQEREREAKRTEREQSANANANRTHTRTHTVCRTRPDQTLTTKATTSGVDTPEPETIVVVQPDSPPRPPRKSRPAAPEPDSDPPLRRGLDAWPKSDCDAVYEAFVSRIGPVSYPRLRKALLPLFESKTAVRPSPDEMVNAVEAFREAREADKVAFRGKYTVDLFAQQLQEWLRLGRMPFVDEWGEPTERGRLAGLAA